MGLIDSLPFPPDPELRRILAEYDRTAGRMNETEAQKQRHDYKIRYRAKLTNLATIRRRSHLTQDDLAFKAGVSRQTISAIENGTNEPSVFLALAIAEALHVTVEDLFHTKPPEIFINGNYEAHWTMFRPRLRKRP
jgi:putative transcriptional regulator